MHNKPCIHGLCVQCCMWVQLWEIDNYMNHTDTNASTHLTPLTPASHCPLLIYEDDVSPPSIHWGHICTSHLICLYHADLQGMVCKEITQYISYNFLHDWESHVVHEYHYVMHEGTVNQCVISNKALNRKHCLLCHPNFCSSCTTFGPFQLFLYKLLNPEQIYTCCYYTIL